jgi:hypothetical protein
MLRYLIVVAAFALSSPAFAVTTADLAHQVSTDVIHCWTPPPNASGSVTVHFELKQDGSIVGKPKVVGLASAGVAETAIQAVQLCQPYQLPPSMFSIWRHTSVKLTLEKGK